MKLLAGSRFGPYEIVAPIGAGGMGEVYRARDPRLGREVAVKVLPEAFTADTERMARFHREAQVLAALNHTHIAAIYGVEDWEGVRALVLELVEGETLAERLAGGPLEPEEALGTARQIADALEAAHEKGIVHRDLKPANVKLTPGGQVKVLDFGLAKALAGDGSSPEISHSPTITAVATRDGVVMGTAAYMSPEQARGKPVDKRSDIWAFGAVLYEMLAGRQAFPGETVSDTLAAILTRDPDWSALPASAPATVRRLLARCLERDRNRRLHDIADARIETEEALAELRGGVASSLPGASAPAARRPPPFARIAGYCVLGLLLLAAVFLVGRRSGRAVLPSAVAGAPTRSIVPLPEGTRLAGWASPVVAISRDGRKLAFVATKEGAFQQLYVHRLDTGETKLVPDSETAEGPFFSPDGEWVAFATDVSALRAASGQLKKFSFSTGLTQAICPLPDYFGGSWSEDESIYFVGDEEKGVWRVAAGGGTAAPVAATVRTGGRDEKRGILWPQLLPGGKSLIVSDEDASRWGSACLLDIASREARDLVPSALSARYVPTGHLLYVDPAGTLFAVPFDLASGRTTGSPIAAARDIAISSNLAGAFAVSDSGSLAYATGYLRMSGRELLKLARIDRSGGVQALPIEPEPYRLPRISHDGRRLAVASWDLSLWVCDLTRNSRIRLPNARVRVMDFPIWTPDGERIAFGGTKEGEPGWKLFLQKADGSAEPEVLPGPGAGETHPMSFTPDGGDLLYDAFGEDRERGIWLLPTAKKGPARRLIGGANSREPMVSPDGRWLAYTSGESGTMEVYVQKYPDLGRKQQISAGGGRSPLWSGDGSEIFYRKGDGLYAVAFEGGAEPKIGAPQLLFEKPGIRGYDVAPDGKGFFAVLQPADSGIVKELHLVTNWFQELNQLSPPGRK